jgi:Putative prokaryotic signal transducing protein
VSKPLACPRCATRYPLEERFCPECGMPLTYQGQVNAEEPASGARAQARKVKPQYTRGDLRRVTTARQQPEAEFIQMMLLDEGIPSTLRRSAGFDVPDFLAAGPRDVMVPESALEAAREVLQEAQIDQAGPTEPGTSTTRPTVQLFAWILVAVGVVALVIAALLAVLY